MEAELKTTGKDRYVPVCCMELDKEETAECVVPDVLPDIARILYTQACVLLRGKEAENGRATITGNIECTVVYAAENGQGLRKLGLSIPFSASVELDDIVEDSRLVARISLNNIDARTLNPRKVLVRGEVHACIEAYSLDHLILTENAAENAGIHTLKRTAQITDVTSINEKTFVLSDELRFSQAKPEPTELLGYRVSVTPEEVKPVGNKLIFKGTVTTALLCLAGESSVPVSETFATTFSQVMEIDEAAEELVPEISIMPTGTYVELAPPSYGNGVATCEIHLVAQAVCRKTREVSYLADAYSCERSTHLSMETLDFVRSGREMILRETVRELMETPSASRELIDTSAQIGPATFSEGTVSSKVTVCALYLSEEGEITSVSKTLKVSSRLDADEGMLVKVLAVRCGEVFAMPTTGGLELRIPVEFVICLTEPVQIPCVTGIELDDEVLSMAERPSVIVVRAGKEDIWSLSKKYLSTPELLTLANPDDAGESGVLLIPRAR